MITRKEILDKLQFRGNADALAKHVVNLGSDIGWPGPDQENMTERLIRYYVTLNVISRPTRIGRDAIFETSHVVQLLHLRRFQKNGVPLHIIGHYNLSTEKEALLDAIFKEPLSESELAERYVVEAGGVVHGGRLVGPMRLRKGMPSTTSAAPGLSAEPAELTPEQLPGSAALPHADQTITGDTSARLSDDSQIGEQGIRSQSFAVDIDGSGEGEHMARRMESVDSRREGEPSADSAAASERIRIIGIGRRGIKCVERMKEEGITGVGLIAMAPDEYSLQSSKLPVRVRIGETTSSRIGTGDKVQSGRTAAQESSHRLADVVNGAEIVFLIMGAAGGTGTGAGPVVAQIAKERGALTIGVVTKPFPFEGVLRSVAADEAMDHFRDRFDTLIVLPNQWELAPLSQTLSVTEAFRMEDDVVGRAVRSITELFGPSCIVGADYEDLVAVLRSGGVSTMASCIATGADRGQLVVDRTIEAVQRSHCSLVDASSVIVSLSGDSKLRIEDLNVVTTALRSIIGPTCRLVFGATIDSKMKDSLRLTILVNGCTDSVLAVERE